MPDAIEFFPITVEQTSWKAGEKTLSQIRQTVFIEEQEVPEAEEWDGKDPGALHWIAWGEKDTPLGCARLVGNKVERMAVLKPYRSKGVGSSILRAIIQHGIEEGMDTLSLHAQVGAKTFYEDNRFVVTGKTFTEAGIPHVPMELDISRYKNRRFEPAPPEISEELRQHIELQNPEDFAGAALQIAERSQRTVRILSQRLIPEVYNSEKLCSLLQNMAVNHPYAKVQILVTDVLWLGTHHHRLVETCNRLQSHMEIRKLTSEVETTHQEFVVSDDESVLYYVNPGHFQGYLCLYSPVEARRLTEDFDSLWRFSHQDPQLRRLYI